MITIVDYQAGNITSVKRALDHLGIASRITADPQQVEQAERIIFPGVGHAATAMTRLRASGLDRALGDAAAAGIPILGICLGAQIMLTWSEEGDTLCLDLMGGEVVRLHPPEGLKVPHMGWNEIGIKSPHPLLSGVTSADTFYFVHSYYMKVDEPAAVIATANHGSDFPVVIGQGNLIATQFHPEKSGTVGLTLLENFSKWEVR